MIKKIDIFDSTLRDGAQAEGISFSVRDKIKILSLMDELGVAYVEAGNPGSNPKDLEFFRQAEQMELKNTKLAAFGSTRRRDINVEDDKNVQSLLQANTPVIVIFGKSWDFHVTDIIRTSLEENLRMIEDTIAFFASQGKEVIFDAEHFFDGYKNNSEYALESLKAAVRGGSKCLVLCETNGGALPLEVKEITEAVQRDFAEYSIGIHCHNDGDLAVANTLMAVQAGASHVQGTFIGFGERCGNASLASIIANLELKMDYSCLAKGQLAQLSDSAHHLAEISNIIMAHNVPFVGKGAFAHKGGMHIDGVRKDSRSFEHIDPALVGNERRFLMSEVAGRSTILRKIQQVSPELKKDSPETREIIDELKRLEMEGYQFEEAESSFELIILKKLGKHQSFFNLDHFKIIGEHPSRTPGLGSSAILKINVKGKESMTASEGDGPVHALDNALRKALENFYPALKEVHLTDYKVRVINTQEATAAKVRVLIESHDSVDSWTTVGVSTDIIEASWIALTDSIDYKLMKDRLPN